MKAILGVLAIVIGSSGLWRALRDGHLRDKSGWIYGRVGRNPGTYWFMVSVCVAMIVVGGLLVWAAGSGNA